MGLERLDRVIEINVLDKIESVVNALEGFSACAGIKDDPDNADKARWNHYGHVGFKGSWVPPRQYITNATSTGGRSGHRNLPDANIALARVLNKTLQDSTLRKTTSRYYGTDRTSKGSDKAFGTTNSPRRVVEQVAKQMLANQMTALESVTPKNTKLTLERKKKRSTQPLIDYGEMKAATRCWVEIDGEDEDVE